MTNVSSRRIASLLLALAAALLPARGGASEFRSIQPIATAPALRTAGGTAASPEEAGLLAAARERALAALPELCRAGVREIADAWNDGDIEAKLAPGYYDRTRMADALDVKVPRDSKLRVLAIESVRPMEMAASREADGDRRFILDSRVAVTVRTQIEYEDPTAGLKKVEGRNEFILRVKQLVPALAR